MPEDFSRAVRDVLRGANCQHARDGRHPIWFSPVSGRHFPVPNTIKSRHTANEILDKAGLPQAF